MTSFHSLRAEALDEEERFGNYERYRTLVENEAAGCKLRCSGFF